MELEKKQSQINPLLDPSALVDHSKSTPPSLLARIGLPGGNRGARGKELVGRWGGQEGRPPSPGNPASPLQDRGAGIPPTFQTLEACRWGWEA